MKFFLRILAIIALTASISINAFADDNGWSDVVRIYTAASADHLGRAGDRSRKTTVPLDAFSESSTRETYAGGIATAVMVDSSVKTAIEQLLGERDYVIVENSVLSRAHEYGGDVYNFIWDRYGFEITFSFDIPGQGIISEIETVYGDDAYLYGELKRSYEDNYSVRIYRAEDLYNPGQKSVDFNEAMLSATVIGSTFQPLLGIHDGLGVLNRLGLASAMVPGSGGGKFVEYRDYEYDGERIYSFLNSIEAMEGDFVDNLYNSIRSICLKHSEDGHIMLPEEFFRERSGDNTDYSLFYYDVLKREDYEVKLVVIDAGTSTELYSTVFFREKGADLWGIIDGNGLEREKAENWKRLPALVFSASVNYFEPDITVIIEDGTIELPPPSLWALSPY